MGNRRRPKNRKLILEQARARMKFGKVQDSLPANHVFSEEALADLGIRNVEIPDVEAEVIKEVPAKVDGVVVGVARIYDDGTVDVVMDTDAPEWAVEKIKKAEHELLAVPAYSEGEGNGAS